MATVFRKTYTKPLPKGAELFTRRGQRFARWKDAKGKMRTAKVTTGKDDSTRLMMEAGTFTAKYRDGSGVVHETSTGCRSEQAARGVLHDLLTRAERVKSGYLTAEQDRMVDHQAALLSLHVADYLDHLKAKAASRKHREDRERYLRRLSVDCGFLKLLDLNRSDLERWLCARADEGMSARSRNAYRAAAEAFCNWCVQEGRLADNPIKNVPKANEKADRRRQRRALTENELVKLLNVARHRPLMDRMTIRRGKNKGKRIAELRTETRQQLELVGWERALIYKTLVLTGLRKGELASITVGQLKLDGPRPRARLEAADEKNRQGSWIPLRADLAVDIRTWLAGKLSTAQNDARHRCEPIPDRLPAEMPLFTVPAGLVRILNRDLKAAGIPKVDDRGWTVDVHALRHTFGTLLSKGGVAPRTAQAAMRHSSIDLTMNCYTDPRLLDVAGAVEALPELPLDGASEIERQKATGTCDDRPLAPMLAPNLVQASISRSTAGRTSGRRNRQDGRGAAIISAENVKRKKPLSITDNGFHKSGRLDLNQRPPAPKAGALPS